MVYTKLERIENQISHLSHLLPKPYQHTVNIPDKILTKINAESNWIEVSLAEQILYLCKGKEIQRAYRVSTGKPGSAFRKSSATRKGIYNIYYMRPKYPMWGKDWYCPDVPFAIFYHHEFAIHGAYWHNNFGTPVSHGCVNMTEIDAWEVYVVVKRKDFVWVH
jgi:lipoprotein-anchoring transpeptidase ErfK/SrfK